jgi:hypothetical protein
MASGTQIALTTVDEAFNEFLRRIELNGTRVMLASKRYNAVKIAIEGALQGKTVRQIGSFQRKTKIRPLDLSDKLDIDAVVSFGPFREYATDGRGTYPESALETVRQALCANETYRVMPQEKNHPTVRLEYADAMSIELAPAFEDLTGQHPHGIGQPNCYIVGDSPSSWKPADYDFDSQVITQLNKDADEKLVPFIKLAKCYFRNMRVPLKSFHTEVLAANDVPGMLWYWKTQGHAFGYHHTLAGFLNCAASSIMTPAVLKGSYSPPVDSETSNFTLIKLADWLKKRSERAWALCRVQDEGAALSGWREFLGDPFPA